MELGKDFDKTRYVCRRQVGNEGNCQIVKGSKEVFFGEIGDVRDDGFVECRLLDIKESFDVFKGLGRDVIESHRLFGAREEVIGGGNRLRTVCGDVQGWLGFLESSK